MHLCPKTVNLNCLLAAKSDARTSISTPSLPSPNSFCLLFHSLNIKHLQHCEYLQHWEKWVWCKWWCTNSAMLSWGRASKRERTVRGSPSYILLRPEERALDDWKLVQQLVLLLRFLAILRYCYKSFPLVHTLCLMCCSWGLASLTIRSVTLGWSSSLMTVVFFLMERTSSVTVSLLWWEIILTFICIWVELGRFWKHGCWTLPFIDHRY